MILMGLTATFGPLALAALAVLVAICLGPVWALSANATTPNRHTDQDRRTFPVGAAVHIYNNGAVGLDPAGYLKAFVPGDLFVGIAAEESDNSAGTAGAKSCQVFTTGDYELPITSVALTDRGKPVFATADDAFALVGHPDAYVGRLLRYVSSGKAIVRMKTPGERAPNGFGSVEHVIGGHEVFEPTGAASTTKYHPSGLLAKSILGLGVLQSDTVNGGVRFDFDAVAEVALASLRGLYGTFEVAKGITFDAYLCVADKGDAAALDIDFGLGTPLTTNSEADIDHADMANLAAFHLDGASDNILAQSDDTSTDVAAVDTTIDNDSTTDLPKRFRIIVRPTGVCEFWIDGARVLSSTVFAVAAAARLAPFVNMEKTSDDTTAVIVLNRLRVAGAAAA